MDLKAFENTYDEKLSNYIEKTMVKYLVAGDMNL